MQPLARIAKPRQPASHGRDLRTLIGIAAVLVVLALCDQSALASPGGSGTLTDVANAFKVTSGGWITTALGYARHLFFALVAIELAWTAITYVLQRDSLPDFVAQLVLKLMGIFFFLALLQNAPTWIPAIVDSFSQAGASIGGQDVVLDPSSTFGQGLELAKNMLGTLNNPAMFTAILPVLLAVFCAIGVVVAYAIVAGQLMIALIESYIVISAGLFLLGFSGSRWTLPFSERYVGYAVSVGIKLFMLYLIVGLGGTLASQWEALFSPGVPPAPEVYVGVAGSALVFMLLGWQIPNLAAALMNGSPSMTLGTAGNVVATTASAGAGVASAVLGVAGLGGAAAVAAASAVAARVTNPARAEQSGPNGAARPIGFIGPAPKSEAGVRTSTSVDLAAGSAPSQTRVADAGQSAPTNGSYDGSAVPSTNTLESEAQSSPVHETTAKGSDATQMPSLEDYMRQLEASGSGRSSKALQSALQMVRSIRMPTLPHDAAGGSIHIRFKHHDGD